MSAVDVALPLIQKWESCRLEAFIPVPGDPPTIGWGATGPSIQLGDVWTQEQADIDLECRVGILLDSIKRVVTVPLSDNQLGALIDFCYNLGMANFQHSTLLKLLNAGDIPGAANQFPLWNKAHGVTLQGLTNRRREEQSVFLTPDNS